MQLYLFQILNGIGIGMIYFLLSVGLTIVFGLLNFVNFAHGAFFLLGSYLCFEITVRTGNFWLALLFAPLCVAALAAALAKGLLNRVVGLSHTAHILITFGIMLVIQEVIVMLWGALPQRVAPPQLLQGAFQVGGFFYPSYRLFLIGVSALAAITLYVLIERTRFGAMVRASSEKAQMVSLLGIDVARITTATFALGGFLAGLGGVMAAPLRGVEPAMGIEALSVAFAVVIVGGLGSYTGALVGGLVIGIVQSMMSTLWPEGARLMIYVVVGAILLTRPTGLLGKA